MLQDICKRLGLLVVILVVVLWPMPVFGEESISHSPHEPYFRVLTSFPKEMQEMSLVNIAYIAIPSPGAVITMVYYRIDNRDRQYIYLNAASGYAPLGSIGEARVLITPWGRNIEFVMQDTNGKVATYVVQIEVTPQHPWSTPPYREVLAFCQVTGLSFWPGRFHVRVPPGGRLATTEAVLVAAGGRVVGRAPAVGSVTVTFPITTAAEMQAMQRQLLEEHADIIHSVSLITHAWREGGIYVSMVIDWPIEVYILRGHSGDLRYVSFNGLPLRGGELVFVAVAVFLPLMLGFVFLTTWKLCKRRCARRRYG